MITDAPVSAWQQIRREARAIVRIGTPLVITQVANQGISFVDTLMAGRYAALDLAGVAIGGSLFAPVFLFAAGILLAVTPAIAKLNGAGKPEAMARVIQQALWLALLISLIGMLVLRNGMPLFMAMGVDQDVATIADGYLKAVSWGFPALMLYLVLRYFFEGLGRTFPVMLFTLLVLILNVPANYVLVFGKLGLPELGGEGCGWATTLVNWLGLVLIAAFTLLNQRLRRFNLFQGWQKPDRREIADIVRVGLPIGIAIFFEVTLFAVVALLLGPLGHEVIAAHQITFNFTTLLFMIPLSVGMATTVQVGFRLGQGHADQARFAGLAGIITALGIASVNCLLLLSLPYQIASLYSEDPGVVALAVALLGYAAVYQFSDAIQIGAAGALRGYQDTTVIMLITLVAYWAVGIPIGYLLGLTDLLRPAMGAAGLWAGIIVGLSVAAVALGWRFHRTSARHLPSAQS